MQDRYQATSDEGRTMQGQTLSSVLSKIGEGYVATQIGGLLALGQPNGRGGIAATHFNHEIGQNKIEQLRAVGIEAKLWPTGSPGKYAVTFERVVHLTDDDRKVQAVPHVVRGHVEWALCRLREHERALAQVQRIRGKGHFLALEVSDRQGDIAKAQARLDEFRKLAPGNDVDAEAFIADLGGEPSFETFGLQRKMPLIVRLQDGLNESTRLFYADPIEVEGDLVKLKCADPGEEYLIKWGRRSEVDLALSQQQADIASRKLTSSFVDGANFRGATRNLEAEVSALLREAGWTNTRHGQAADNSGHYVAKFGDINGDFIGLWHVDKHDGSVAQYPVTLVATDIVVAVRNCVERKLRLNTAVDEQWRGDVVYQLEVLGEMDNGDADGFAMAHEGMLDEHWQAGLSPAEAAAKLLS